MRNLSSPLRLLVVLAIVVMAAVAGGTPTTAAGAASASPSGAPSPSAADPNAAGVLDVVAVAGLIDRVEADYLTTSIRAAESRHAVALVVQLDSGGGVLGQAQVDQLAYRIAHAEVPVAVWVGGRTGARAEGPAYELLRAATLSGVGPGTRVGRLPTALLRLGTLGQDARRDPLATKSEGGDAAVRDGLVTFAAPTLGDFVVGLDGRQTATTTLHTATVVGSGSASRRQPDVQAQFSKLGLVAGLLHTASSPSVAYLLLLIAAVLIVFEFYSAGIGVAGIAGAGALILACYGLGNLPVRIWALALVGLAVFGYAVDVQAGAARVWTGIATAALAVATPLLYAGLRPSPLAMVTGVAGTALFMIAGMPAMIRSRFSTPTIGRSAMIGEMGEAMAAIDPEGTVEVRGAPWRARTNRATPIAAGDAVRVVGIDGLLLEVEPEKGGARDYRH